MRTGSVLAALAIGLAALAPVVGTGGARGPGLSSAPGVAELTAELAARTPMVDAVELAERIRARRPMRVVDVRDSSAFMRFSIPTAERVPFNELRAAIEPGTEVVLYDAGGGDAVRGWHLLRRLGHDRVRILDGGVAGWVDGVLSPVLPAGTPEERARYDRVAAVSRYFGGVPRVGDPAPATTDADAAVRLLSRRGCY